MIQTILFATDLCVFTPYMLQHVTSLASRYQAKIVVVHAVEPLGTLASALVKTYRPEQQSDGFDENNLDEVILSLKDKVIDLLADEYVVGEEDGLQHIKDVAVVSGKPAEVILDKAAECHADLIMMGSHGPDPLNGFSLGSVAHKVLQMANIPVYMVPMLPMAAGDHLSRDRQMSLW